ncbi:MAG: Ig-like domain repeat protein [Bacteroidetes bacterium]|nr:Ig-like domain repeat protein [Bacteroidota bacterium]
MNIAFSTALTGLNKFTYSSLEALAGKSKTISKNVAIPIDAAVGEYTLSAFCSDAASNVSSTLTRTFTIKDTISPSLTHFSNVAVSLTEDLQFTAIENSKGLLNKIEVKKISTNQILANIEDNIGIEKVNCLIRDGGKVYQNKNMTFSASQLQHTWNYNYPNPQYPDQYIVLTVFDINNNQRQFQITIP